MKLLLVTWFFPTSNTIGAVRLGAMARYLSEQGHDIRVITAKDPPYVQSLELKIPPEQVTKTRWINVNRPAEAIARLIKPRGASGGGSPRAEVEARPASPPPRKRLLQKLKSSIRDAYCNLFNWPDKWVGWLPYATIAGSRLVRGWTPDVVFASGPPFTTLLVGYLVSRLHGIPLVLEFRDRWWDDPYYPPASWIVKVSRFVERRLVARAGAICTVSEPWAETYRARYGKPTLVVYNGYDANSSALQSSPAAGPQGGNPDEGLRIVYTGGIYPGRRDPSPLFEAVKLLGLSRSALRIEFYGTDPSLVLPLAERAGVTENVTVHSQVTHEEAIAAQGAADVLLLMQWNDPKEQGNVPGKFFEYLGALRPILILGLKDGVPASIVRDRNAGRYAETPDEIASVLKEWLETKRMVGSLPPLPEEARSGFSRDEQFCRLEQFLGGLIRSGHERSPRTISSEPRAGAIN